MLEFLSKIKLTVNQWLLAMLAAAVGALIVAFKLQGKALRKAQLHLLLKEIESATKQDDVSVASKKEKYAALRKVYEKEKKASNRKN